MEVLETLAVALGFATLAGLNLYLTVFITGLAINQQLIDISSRYPELAVLGEPVVLIAAGAFALLEFFSDKIPWVDSFWDSIHTLIRPIGGGLLALQALGPVDPQLEVIVAMLAASAAFMTHGLKSGTRLAVNTSPEPVTNVTMSVTEDLAVIGGLALMSLNPFIFAAICLVFLVLAAFVVPRLARRCRAMFWLAGKKISSLFRRGATPDEPPAPPEHCAYLERKLGQAPEIAWSLPVLVGRNRRMGKLTTHTFGMVFALKTDESALHFVGRRSGRLYHQPIPVADMEVALDNRWLSQDVVLEDREKGRLATFKFAPGYGALARRLCAELTGRSPSPASATQIAMAGGR